MDIFEQFGDEIEVLKSNLNLSDYEAADLVLKGKYIELFCKANVIFPGDKYPPAPEMIAIEIKELKEVISELSTNKKG